MKALKISAKILLIVILLVIIAMLVVPYFYKDKIAELVKTEINKQVKAKVDFNDVDLSLFRNFPDFSLGIKELSVVNLTEDTLLMMDGFYVTVGLMSVFNDDAIEIKSVLIDKPDLSLKVNERGKTNWDIMKETESDNESGTESDDEVALLLKKIQIRSGNITYRDDESKILATLEGFNGLLKGKFAESRTNMNLKLSSDAVTVTYDDVTYLDKTIMDFDAVVDANLDDEIYNLRNNTLYLNGLRLNFEGSVAYVDDDLSLMLVYNAPDNSFKELLSLVPAIYQQDFEKLTTSGNFEMDGYVKGVYSETKMPDFKMHTKVDGAEISYQDMPASLNNITFDLLVDSKGNDLDNMTVKLDKFAARLGKDEVNLNLFLATLFSDPYIDAKATADFHLENLKQVFPQEGFQNVSGGLLADFTLKGNVSAAEKNDFNKMLAMGSLICKNIKFNYGPAFPVEINHAQFNFSPAQIDVIGFDSRINGNKLLADGRMENYLGYFLKDNMFTGNLNMSSGKLDLNELLKPWSSEENDGETGGTEGSESEITYIPENMDVIVSLKADTVIYQKLVFTAFNSKVHVHEGKVDFEEFNSDFLGGLIDVKGYYEATEEVTPHVDFDLSLKDMSVGKAYQNLTVFKQFAPIAEKADGIFNSTLSFSANLDRQMNPVWTSILGSGKFTSDNIELNAQDFVQKITDVLKVKLFDNPTTGPIDLKFKMLDGKLYNSPFHVKMNGVDVEVAGWTAFNQQIDYTLGFNIPVKLLGNDVAGILEHYAAEAGKFGIDLGDVQNLKPVVEVTGNYKNPQVKLVSMGKTSGKSAKDILKDKADEIVDEYAEKANKEAQKILDDAKRQSDSLIHAAQVQADAVMQTARQSMKKIKADAQAQADQLVKEAAKQGPIAELAAKKAAQELLKKADEQAGKVMQEAQNQSDKIVESARQKADKITQQAKEKADKIRK
jgi:cell division septum initiation protein DivIVA